MFSFFKRKKDQLIVPKWASFFSSAEYRSFIEALDKFFYQKNITYALDDDGSLKAGPNDFEFDILGLTNLAQICKQAEISNYYELISGHFESMIRTYQYEKKFKEIVDDYDAITEFIAVRLYPMDFLEYGGKENKVYRVLAGDIAEVLVFDLPDAVQTITPKQAGKWNKTWDELFETGKESVLNRYPCNATKESLGDIDIWFVHSDHFFTPNIVFDLKNNPQLIGSKGSLIGVPHRHAVLIYPINDLDFVNAINTLIPVIYGMNQEGPGSVSNNLIWYYNGEFEHIPCNIEGETVQIIPTDRFLIEMGMIEP